MGISNDFITHLPVIFGLAVLVAALVLILVGYLVAGAPPLPSTAKARDAMLDLLPESVEGEVHEIGCAWGGMALTLAKQYPDAKVIAWEVSLLPYLVAKVRAALSGRRNLHIRLNDGLKTDLSAAAVVTCYLTPPVMAKLASKLSSELAPGAVVVSNTFALHGWEPEAVHTLDDLYATQVYLYRKEPSQFETADLANP